VEIHIVIHPPTISPFLLGIARISAPASTAHVRSSDVGRARQNAEHSEISATVAIHIHGL
jgi:hypothetical protein